MMQLHLLMRVVNFCIMNRAFVTIGPFRGRGMGKGRCRVCDNWAFYNQHVKACMAILSAAWLYYLMHGYTIYNPGGIGL